MIINLRNYHSKIQFTLKRHAVHAPLICRYFFSTQNQKKKWYNIRKLQIIQLGCQFVDDPNGRLPANAL